MFESIQFTANQWTLLCATGIITWFVFYVRRKLTYWERKGIDGSKPLLPFVDVLFGKLKPINDKLKDNYNQYGKIYGVYNGLTPTLVIGDPDLLKSICVKDFASWPQGFGNSGYLHPVERHLVSLYGDQWKRMRILLSPTFSSGKIKKMFQIIKACNLEAEKVLTKMTTDGQADFDPKYFWGRYNLDVIAKCCFAANLDVYGDKEDSLLKRFIQVFQPKRYKIFLLLLLPKFAVRLFKITPADTENLDFFRDLTYALIEKRKSAKTKADDFLQLLIDLGNQDESESGESKSTNAINKSAKLTLDEIVASSVVFLLAGYETTSTLLTWACYRLAINPNVQEKLYDEVSKADIYDYEVLSTLPYLDAVINETLRIDPPVLLFQRHNHTEYVIPGTNVVVPKGTSCSIPTYAIHHDPENYPNPEVFDPERFIKESPKPFTFLPFGAGPRICIGMRFALINAKLSLASLVRKHQIVTTEKTPEKIEIDPTAVIYTAKSLQLGIKPRS